MRKRTAIVAASVCLAVVGSAPAHAAGYALKEQSATAQGNAFAGASAAADDISYMFFNPAAIAWHAGRQAQLSLSFIYPYASPSGGEASTITGQPIAGQGSLGNIGDGAVVGAAYATLPLSEAVFVGLAANTPFGLSTEYPRGWVGRFHAVESELQTLNLNPVVAWRPIRALALGAGLQIQYADAELSNAVDVSTILGLPYDQANDSFARVEGDDWSYGFTLGAQLDLAGTGTRVGIGYRSRIDHELDGDADFRLSPAGRALNAATTTPAGDGLLGESNARAAVETPDSVGLGLAQRLGTRWTVLAELAWTNWSLFDELRIEFDNPDQPDNVTEQGWNDSWFAALGVTFRPDDAWTWRAGVAFDQSPVPEDLRTPRIPDGDRYWASIGATWQPRPWLSLQAALTQILVEDVDVDLVAGDPGNQTRGDLSVDYDSRITIASLGATFRF